MVDRDRELRLWYLLTGSRCERGWAGFVCDLVVAKVGVDAAAISLRTSGGAEELVAASDSWAEALEELQYTLGEGPGVAAFASAGPVMVPDLLADAGRWPGFETTAGGDGLAAVFAFPIESGRACLGTLDLYRRRPGELSADGLADATALADLAMIALLSDTAPAESAGWAREDEPGHYKEVNQAAGMLAVNLRISVDDATIRLRAYAFSSGQAVLDVAHEVLSRQLGFDAFQD